VFEPFFTTKDVWTNIGLGLAVAYRVMQEHGGSIAVASEPGHGAEFTLLFKSVGTVKKKSSDSSLDVGGQGKGITG
jgi:signal transduction histidine kinase